MRLFHRPIAPHLSPNSTRTDVWFVARWLLNPLAWLGWYVRGPVDELEGYFRTQCHASFAYSFDAGRTALAAVLEACQCAEGSMVVIQAFTCVAVPNAIRAARLTPVYVDIDASLNIDVHRLEQLFAVHGDAIQAVIVQHTFGVPADVQRIVALCHQHGALVIEDCAHSLGATVDGQRVGTFGDAAIYSFGRDKVISTVSGGVATTQHAAIGQQLHRLWKARRYPSPAWIAQRLLHPLVFSLSLPFYDIKIGVAVIALLRALRILPAVLDAQERRGQQPFGYRYPGVLARWALCQLRHLDEKNDRRRMNASCYREVLSAYPSVQLQQPHPSSISVWLRFAVFVDDVVSMKQFFEREGILLGDWYDTPVAPRTADPASVGYSMGSCPVAESAALRVVNVPTHPAMTGGEFEHVQQTLKHYMYTTYGNHTS